MNAKRPVQRRGLSRRRVLATMAGTGSVAFAGCALADPPSEDGPIDRDGRLSIEIRSDTDRPFRAETAIIDEDESFEEGLLGTSELGNRGDITGISAPDISGGPFRVVVRIDDGFDIQEVSQRWDLEECSEFDLRVTVMAEETAVSTSCTHRRVG